MAIDNVGTFQGNSRGVPTRELESLTASVAVTASHAIFSDRILHESASIGSGINPVFIGSGSVVPISGTVGNETQSVYLKAGTITRQTASVGSAINPVYQSAGNITASKATVGSQTQSVFLNGGEITAQTATVGSDIRPVMQKAGHITAITGTVGTVHRPVYVSGGQFVVTDISESFSASLASTSHSVSASLNAVSNSISGTLYAESASINSNVLTISQSISGTLYAESASVSGTIFSISRSVSQSLYTVDSQSKYRDTTNSASFSASLSAVSQSISGSLNSVSQSISGTLYAESASINIKIQNVSQSLSGTISALSSSVGSISSSFSQSIGSLSASIATTTFRIESESKTRDNSLSSSLGNISASISGTLYAVSRSVSASILRVESESKTRDNTLSSSVGSISQSISQSIYTLGTSSAAALNAYSSSVGTTITKVRNSSGSWDTTAGWVSAHSVSVQSVEAWVGRSSSSLETHTASVNSWTASAKSQISALHTATASYNSKSSSWDAAKNWTGANSGNLATFTSSLKTLTISKGAVTTATNQAFNPTSSDVTIQVPSTASHLGGVAVDQTASMTAGTASRLSPSFDAGSTSKPVYFTDGRPAAITSIQEMPVTASQLRVTGDAIIAGNMIVDGTASFRNRSDLLVGDALILVASGSTSQAAANGAGIAVQTASATSADAAEAAAARIQYRSSDNHFTASVGFVAPSFTGSLQGNVSGKTTSASRADSALSADSASHVKTGLSGDGNSITMSVGNETKTLNINNPTNAASASHANFSQLVETKNVLTASVGNQTRYATIVSSSYAVSSSFATTAATAQQVRTLKITGSVNATYNGSSDVIVNIPDPLEVIAGNTSSLAATASWAWWAKEAGNADTLDGTHKNGLFTQFVQTGLYVTGTVGDVTKTYQVVSASRAISASRADSTPYSHTHGNKAVLDGITAAMTASWQTAASNSHTHGNKAVLDGISAAKTASWDAKQAAISDLATIRSNATDGNTALTWITANSSSALTDTKVTSAGNHYTPTKAGTSGSSTARYYIKTIDVDAKGHVTGVTTGNETVTNTDTKVTAVGNHYTPTQSTGKAASAGSVISGLGLDAAGHVVSVTGSNTITSASRATSAASADNATVATGLGVAANTSASVAAAIAAKWTYNENTIKGVKVTSASRADSAATAGSATSASNADTVDSLHASDFTRFYLSPLDVGASADSAQSWFVNTMPAESAGIIYNVPGAEKTIIVGKSSNYGHMLQLNYDDSYLRILRYRAGNWLTSDWEKISAGYADSAGSATTAGSATSASRAVSAASADSVAWGNVSGKPHRAGSDTDGGPAQTLKGAYTANGGQQNPNYFGTNKVGVLMMNTTVNGNSQYKDWIIMDAYSGNDVGGAVAFGVNRQTLGAYIMRSEASRSVWAESAELIGTHNFGKNLAPYTSSWASAAANSHTHSNKAFLDSVESKFLPVTGGTITGDVTFNSKFAQGDRVTASGQYSHAEGRNTAASGNRSHAEGSHTKALGDTSHAEGFKTNASGEYSHAEGDSTKALGWGSHAEGSYAKASGSYSHAEGNQTEVSGYYSHAEGSYAKASGNYSHAEGYSTIASNDFEHAQGSYNVTASGQIFSVGCGDWQRRRNAISIITGSNPSASVYIYGIGGYDGTNPTSGTNDLATTISHASAPSQSAGATTGTVVLPSGQFVVCGTLTGAVTFTLGSAIGHGKADIYAGQFTFGSSVQSVSFPSSIKWVEGVPDLSKPNSTYEFSICNNVGLLVRTA